MQITLAAVLRMVKEMPETFEFEELQQWIYLRQKLEGAEQECDEGGTLTHEQALAESFSWFRG